jgi:hypothetical protein
MPKLTINQSGEFKERYGKLEAAGYGEVITKPFITPGKTYTMQRCLPAAVGYKFKEGRITVTQAVWDRAVENGGWTNVPWDS